MSWAKRQLSRGSALLFLVGRGLIGKIWVVRSRYSGRACGKEGGRARMLTRWRKIVVWLETGEYWLLYATGRAAEGQDFSPGLISWKSGGQGSGVGTRHR